MTRTGPAFLEQWRRGGADVPCSAAAAGLSWWFAAAILGDRLPVFAPIAAVISLSPGVASRSRQTLGILAGVVIGIVIGSAVRMAGINALAGVRAADVTCARELQVSLAAVANDRGELASGPLILMDRGRCATVPSRKRMDQSLTVNVFRAVLMIFNGVL